jgi:hypothetical protein
MRSKHFAMSASSTYLLSCTIALNMAPIASWHERPGLNPYELGSNRASHSGYRSDALHRVYWECCWSVYYPPAPYPLPFGSSV